VSMRRPATTTTHKEETAVLRKRTRTPITIAGFVGAAGLACSVATATPSLDFGIDDNTEYQAFLNAVKRAEYIRDDFLTGAIAIYDANGDVIGEAANPPGTKMSVIGTIAATIAFMERNPTALGGATEDFIEAFEAELESLPCRRPLPEPPLELPRRDEGGAGDRVISTPPRRGHAPPAGSTRTSTSGPSSSSASRSPRSRAAPPSTTASRPTSARWSARWGRAPSSSCC
jgi:hypothetical protein